MADLGLADAMNAPEPLLQPIRVPWQVVVHHQIRALEIYALTRSIRSNQHANVWVGPKQRLKSAAFVAMRSAMDSDDRLGIADHPCDPLVEVVQSVAMFGKDDELALASRGVAHFRIVLENLRELFPFPVLAGCDDCFRLLF